MRENLRVVLRKRNSPDLYLRRIAHQMIREYIAILRGRLA
jgi:hypothetical protein